MLKQAETAALLKGLWDSAGGSVWGRCQPACRRAACDSSRDRPLRVPSEWSVCVCAAAPVWHPLLAWSGACPPEGVTHHSPAAAVLRTQTGVTW